MEPHEELTARQMKHEPAFYVGQWVMDKDGNVTRVRNRSIEADGSRAYIVDPSNGSEIAERDLTACEHSLPLGQAVQITTPNVISGPMGDREERDDTVYRVMGMHRGEQGEELYALGKHVRDEWVQVAVVAREHLTALDGDATPEFAPVRPQEQARASAKGIMT